MIIKETDSCPDTCLNKIIKTQRCWQNYCHLLIVQSLHWHSLSSHIFGNSVSLHVTVIAQIFQPGVRKMARKRELA